MNIYLIKQKQNENYDSYDSAVVAAMDEYTAKRINPETGDIINNFQKNYELNGDWCTDVKYVECSFIGIAKENITQGVILASYNAG